MVVMVMIVMFAFSLFSTAVFAEPPVTEIKEVSRLVHGQWKPCALIFAPGVCSLTEQITRCKTQSLSALPRRAERAYRLESGESISLTGTLIRLPSRKI